MMKLSKLALGTAALSAVLSIGTGTAPAYRAEARTQADAPAATARIVSMRRIAEAQYRNVIADVFGNDITVSGRFEPIVRPAHELIAHGATAASISPSGFEQFDAMARTISEQVFDEAHRSRFVPCAPKKPDAADEACARKTLEPLGKYLFRRPLNSMETNLYTRMASEAVAKTGSFHKGLELALAAMLVSPNFLYIVETAEPDPANPGALRIDNYSRASRLSFMLWNSTPNETLLSAASRGDLTKPEKLKQNASAMVESPRFEQGVRAFFADMLLFEKFDEIAKDPLIYPYFNQPVAQAMPEQMLRMIVDHLVARDGDYRDLFTTRRTFMNRPLASLYRVPVRSSDGWQLYEFPDGDDRAGLLGQAGFLALYSHSGRSSPTLRGKAVRELLMCQPVPPPPGDVNFTAVQDTANKAMPTARVRLNAHVSDPVCAGCHMITDPIGLSMERFDGIGAFRMTENEAAIETSGSMDGMAFEGASGLGKTLAESQDTSWCVSSRALEYALGETPDTVSPMVEKLEADFAASGYRIRDLFLNVATLPEAWQVPEQKLDQGKTSLTMASK
ncbi:MAG: DUF1592 domain-containing protein [Novosphingobium sp.]|nr:DUF1592 domain-containing protein [Novosphingobium sp.]